MVELMEEVVDLRRAGREGDQALDPSKGDRQHRRVLLGTFCYRFNKTTDDGRRNIPILPRTACLD